MSYAAAVSWALNGPFANVLAEGSETIECSASFAELAGAVLVGLAGAQWITSEADERLAKATAVEVAGKNGSTELASRIACASPRRALQIAKDAPETTDAPSTMAKIDGSGLSEFLKPVPGVHPRPADPIAARYIRSYLIMRAAVGALGIALPFALVLVDGLWFDGDPFPRTSLSAYYYTGARELFVGALSAIGVFLITYKVAERNLDNTLSFVAGVAVVVVALFPTSRPNTGAPLTPLQERLGESFAGSIHFVAAGAFILSLAAISYSFGRREGARDHAVGKRSPRFWQHFHWICAVTIVAAFVWSGVTELSDWGPRRSLLYGEAVAVWAFGVSWLWKGLELDMLRKDPS